MNKILASLLLSLTLNASASSPLPSFFILSPNQQTAISTCWHDAGAICSVMHNGFQMIDDYDHGRQLQSAVSFDGKGEAENPTEAGSSFWNDGVNPHASSSILLSGDTANNILSTTSRMAYWNPLLEPRKNPVRTSNIVFQKRVEFIRPNVIRYEVAYTIPSTETHTSATFETLTAYMPSTMSDFWTLDVFNGDNTPRMLDDGPGEQPKPVIVSTGDQSHAMGIYSLQTPGYGRWRFKADMVTKWNSVQRVENPRGTYRYVNYVIFGTLQSVADDMIELHNSLN